MADLLQLEQVQRSAARGLRGHLRRRLLEQAQSRATELDEQVLMRPTVVLAPHFDDETLGCGGTLLRGGALGAERHVIFLTDGSVSHRDWIDSVSLQRSRTAEGQAAAVSLGMQTEQIHCLNLPETDLFAHLDQAVPQVVEVLRAVEPGLVVLPYRHEPPPDHRATYEIGIRAVQALNGSLDVLEYPIWVWDAWPFTAFPLRPWQHLPRRMQEHYRLVRRTLGDMDTRVSVGDVLGGKLAALNEHRTQMYQPQGQDNWPTLPDVKGGDWLSLFFEPFELFHRTVLRRPGSLTEDDA